MHIKFRLASASFVMLGLFLLTGTLMGQEPTTQPSALTVSNLGSGTLTLSWTGGDGSNTIILAKAGSAVDSDPVDATTYTADHFSSGTQIGTGNFVVFSGSASTALIQGLSASTTYHFAAYEFNTGGAPTPDYLTTGPATTSTTTSAALDLYSFQSGDAEDASTWTTDATGVTQVGSAVPGAADDATVLASTTVTVTTNNFDVNQFTVASTGTLTLGTTTSHDFGTLTGTGLVQSASDHPAVTVNTFATTSGGTFEYVTSAGSFTLTSSDATTYNNLIIDNTSITMGLDLTVNGTLTLENSATMTLGNSATARTFSFDDISVELGSTIATNATSTGVSTPHTASITGDITNNGTIDFTAQASAEYTTNPSVGVVEVSFTGTGSQSLSCSGNTDFYRFIVDKGSNQTATLTVSSTSTSNFRIFGRNNRSNTSSGDDANPTVRKAFWIKNGTLELGSNISIESLSEGGVDFFIPENGALHVNGATVSTTTTANGTNRQGVTIVGKLQISSGSFDTGNSNGIAFAGESAELDVDGGTLTASQLNTLSTTIGTVNSLAYNQSNGTVNIDRSGANSNSFARFDMEAADLVTQVNSFTMSGGTLTVSDPSSLGGISIVTRAADFSVTGGTIVAEVTGSNNFGIAVNGAFHNLTLQESAGGASGDLRTFDDGPITMTELDVNGDLVLSTLAVFDPQGDDVKVGGDFTIPALTTYVPGANTTTFDGTGNQVFTIAGSITSGLNNLEITNTTGSVTVSGNFDMNGAFSVPANGSMDLGTNTIGGTGTIAVSGEVQTSNSNGLSGGASTTFESTLASVTLNAGSNIVFNAAGAQTITADTYDGLEIGGSGVKSLAGATTVSGVLNISAGELSIGANTLTLDGTITGAGTITGSTTSNISVGGTGDLGTIDFTAGGNTLGDLTVNRTASGTVDFEEDFTINTSTTLTEGFINLAESSVLTLGASGSPATVTGGSATAYFDTDPTDDDTDTEPEIDIFHEGGADVTIPMGYNPFFSISVSCPTCSGHRFKLKIKRGPYNTPPSSGSRVTTDVVAAQWDLRKISGGTVDVTVTLCWSGSGETTGLGNDVGISIWDSNLGSPFWDVGNNISTKTGSDPFCQSRTITVDGNQRIFMGVTNDQSPLPVTLLTFNGEMNDEGNIDLNWETADELNNDFFQVQRSSTGLGDWEPLGYVTGNGNSDQIISYSFTDDNVSKDEGFLYYRLKQVDFNGTFEYSPVISVAIDSELFETRNSWKVYPNPSNGFNLQMVLVDPRLGSGDSFRFRLLNMKGKVLHDANQTAAIGAEEVIKKLSFSGSGLYILEISSGNRVERHRLIKN